jgi:K+-transporting ATPase ATPase C chain
MIKNIIPALRLTIVCLIFFVGIYSAIIWSIAQFAPGKGKIETVTQNGKTYYPNVGQAFTQDQYFWTRPSAVDYNAAGAGGSNKGPSNPDYLKDVENRIDNFIKHNPTVTKADIPSEMVTASGSGLDPHISVQGAKIQIDRIAKVRNIQQDKLNAIIIQNTEKPLFGLFGTEKINVLKLNLALDNLK